MKRVTLFVAASAVFCAVPAMVNAAPMSAPSEPLAPATGAPVEFPLTIEHRFGTTTFDAPPERIVSLDDQWTDVLTAMGGPLAAAAETPLLEEGRYPWQDVIADNVESSPVTDVIPYEAVAAADPDLIVITYFAPDQETYDRLNEIAPTIGPLGEAVVERWQDLATTAGAFLGTPDVASDLIADADQASADLRSELPGLEGLDYALANYVAGDGIYITTDPDEGASRVFADLGLVIDPELAAMERGAYGRVELSTEEIGQLDSDLLLLLTNGTDPADIPGFDALPAAQSGAVAILDVAQATGLNTPSPLSVPWSLDAIKPALEAANAAAG